jgi:hypothetical protein
MEIAATTKTHMDTQHLIMTKTTPTQTMNDHRTSAHFTTITEPSLLTETEKATIGWNQELTNF